MKQNLMTIRDATNKDLLRLEAIMWGHGPTRCSLLYNPPLEEVCS